MKLPNGTGSVYKLSGNRRKPWIVRKTKGWAADMENGKTKQLYFIVGYYPTRIEALGALLDYNADECDVELRNITFAEVYEEWKSMHFPTIVASTRRAWSGAFKHSQSLHNMRMRDIRTSHLEKCIEVSGATSNIKRNMKNLYGLMFRYCLKYEIVNKDYAALCDCTKESEKISSRNPFSEAEIKKLWEHADIPFADMLLIAIYSGWRPQELMSLKTADVDLKKSVYFGGLKTDAGRNRCVPIHPGAKELVKANYKKAAASGSPYLFNDKRGPLNYKRYRSRFSEVCSALGFSHRPHDTRHTFITLAKNAEMDEYILKLIVGHSINDITEKVYTHRKIEQLAAEIAKIQI